MPQIEVAFDIDANGIVNVSAKDKATNKEQAVTIQSSGGLSDEQIQNMVRDAETYASKDAERKTVIEAKNDADTLIYSTENSVREHRDKLSADVITAVETEIAALKTACEQEDAQAIRDAIAAAQKAAMKIGEAL